ncbi:MAG: DNA-3-methyladenine glycosylase I [Prolixibacteraceae bacterium]|jgi:DNA-3-methyladenine glycosylase I|nr:DNA-3-methyladenine glycosylase I [Prolixibacteraceae bacterium]
MNERCSWSVKDPLYIQYHDEEWGVPVHDDKKLFEFLILEGVQAGLSWLTVLRKRENYRKAYDDFEVEKVAAYGQDKIDELMNNEGLVRNKLKILASINNAQRFIGIQKEFGSFDRYIWGFIGGETIVNHWESLSQIPATSPVSDAISRDMKKRGFKFVGSTIIYAHMQATGMVNDHLTSCFRHREIR